MEPKIFYVATFDRLKIKTFFFTLFFLTTRWPRLLIEVFVRKNMGRFYMSFGSAVALMVINGALPVIILKAGGYFNWGDFFTHYLSWYIFFSAFGYVSWQRHRESYLPPGEYNLNTFSKYSGDRDIRFSLIKIGGKPVTPRQVATLLEPGLFLAIGLVLIILSQPIGYLIAASSISYSLGYFGAYHLGDVYVQEEIIDASIFHQELKRTWREAKYPDGNKGFELFDMPNDPEFRRMIANYFDDDEEALEAY